MFTLSGKRACIKIAVWCIIIRRGDGQIIYRKAVFADVEQIYDAVNAYAKDGVMLARSRNTLYETLRDMYVAEEDGRILGAGGLHIIWNEV